MLLSQFESGQDAYTKTQVEGVTSVSSPIECSAMVHQKIVDELNVLVGAIKDQDIKLKTVKSQRVIELIAGLDATLDLDAGDLVVTLHKLYEHTIQLVSLASIRMDVALITEAQELMDGLMVGWEGAMNNAQSQKPVGI
ncbi:flagellar protein FliS [Vibrio breoganii]|uniref:flagellar export chaperone FliS n=1 Tax=Vibrio breoganii TaxID=553239 RepID=UPI000C817571|nr:flagellar protein FliS [Vibrio breoganii]PML12763.1 hypothetical protein BCT84_02440 [Vibrio breoganii]